MFNLNIPAASLLTTENGLGTIPKTPEIVNTLIAMQSPLDSYNFTTTSDTSSICGVTPNDCDNQNSELNSSEIQQQNFKNNNLQLTSQDSSHSNGSYSPLDSPTGTSTTPSVQQTCSQLIKAGLKLSIQSKRKMSNSDSSSGNEQPPRKYSRKSSENSTALLDKSNSRIQQSDISQKFQQPIVLMQSSVNQSYNATNSETSEDDSCVEQKHKSDGMSNILTAEDEDRRRRRRERNKIAATKCRMKKREKTFNLISESETLEKQNIDLKSQVQNLEIERRQIFEMLQKHSCLFPNGYQPPPKLIESPAFKYFKSFELNSNKDNNFTNPQQSTRTIIPSVDTIKYSRMNCLKPNRSIIGQNLQSQTEILPNGYCKASPSASELGYINSPTQDTVNTCQFHQLLTSQAIVTSLSTNKNPSEIITDSIPQQKCNELRQVDIRDKVLKSENSYDIPISPQDPSLILAASQNDSLGVTQHVENVNAEFVLKSEYIESPYTTDKSAERFLCETNYDTFDVKQNNLIGTNSLNSQSHATLDFNTQLTVTGPTSYDNILSIKNDFLNNDELLTEICGEPPETEFTDLDSGISYVQNISNGGCLV